MIKIKPSVADLDISEKRRKDIVEEVSKSFFDTAIGRKIVDVEYTQANNSFRRIGVNIILDKVFVVDIPSSRIQDTYYSHEGLGLRVGREIALSETKMVVDSILSIEFSEDNVIERPKEWRENDLLAAMKRLEERNQRCDSILTSISDQKVFWLSEFKFFKWVGDRTKSTFGLEGHFKDVPVYWSNYVPDGTIMFLNKGVGTLLVKKDISTQILKLQEEEFGKIEKDFTQFRGEELREKVRMVAEELVTFQPKTREAVVISKSIV